MRMAEKSKLTNGRMIDDVVFCILLMRDVLQTLTVKFTEKEQVVNSLTFNNFFLDDLPLKQARLY
jgi:hypothetical protein